jgi:Protein of unknown function (DUF2959)
MHRLTPYISAIGATRMVLMPGFHTMAWRPLVALLLCVLATLACDRLYYNTMKRFGWEKRDILVDRVRNAQQAQTEAKDEFQTALERFKTVISVEDSNLESKYETLSRELERSEDRAKRVRDRVKAVREVSEDLFTSARRSWASTPISCCGPRASVSFA